MNYVAACWHTTEVIVRANVVPEVAGGDKFGGGTHRRGVAASVVSALCLCWPAAETTAG